MIDVAVSPQKKYFEILEEQKDLQLFIKERQEMTQKFKQRTEKVTEGLKKDQIAFEEQIAAEKVGVGLSAAQPGK